MTGATSAETHGPIPDRGGTATASPFCFADTSDNASHEEPSVHAISANTARPQKVRGGALPTRGKSAEKMLAPTLRVVRRVTGGGREGGIDTHTLHQPRER